MFPPLAVLATGLQREAEIIALLNCFVLPHQAVSGTGLAYCLDLSVLALSDSLRDRCIVSHCASLFSFVPIHIVLLPLS